MQVIERHASAQYPNLDKNNALEQLFAYILNSIIMDFHPEDLYIPAINGSDQVDFKVIKIEITNEVASKFAQFFVSNNKKSFENLNFELRRRLFSQYKLLMKARTPKSSNPKNSFGYPSQ